MRSAPVEQRRLGDACVGPKRADCNLTLGQKTGFPLPQGVTLWAMSGTDVDGTKYDIPDVPWVNYFNGGDAVHGYERGSYGFPQSNGCVELPIETAKTVFGMLALGDIVYITG